MLLRTEPQYTDEARAAKVQGTVVLYVEIGPDGVARNVQVIRPLGLDGAPVAVAATIEVNFRLF